MYLKHNKERVLKVVREFKGKDYKGDPVDYVTYEYRDADSIPKPAGVTISETAYTKLLPTGQQESIVYGIKSFHQIGDNWHLVYRETVEKSEWDRDKKVEVGEIG